MSTGAIITVNISNGRLDDTTTSDKVAAIDFSHELEENGLVSPAVSDQTTIPVAGTIRRVITANLTQTFMDSYPDDPSRIAALHGWIKGSISQRIPFIEDFATETITLF